MPLGEVEVSWGVGIVPVSMGCVSVGALVIAPMLGEVVGVIV